MKRLLIALIATVAVSTASAIITDTQLFETSFADFVADVQGEDSSEITAYENGTQPDFNAPYPCGSYGDNYLKLDTGDATLWRTNASEAANIYFDMAVQFTPTAEDEEPDPTGNKIVIFMDAETNVVVISGTSAVDHTPVTNRYGDVIAAKSWARLTISAAQDQGSLIFRVNVDGMPISRNVFYSLDEDTTVREVGFSGSGAVDDFVARTTDPYYGGGYAASIGSGDDCEKYLSYTDALVDALVSAPTIAVIDNNVTNYLDGSENNPYQIPNAASLLALQDAVLANPAVCSLNFVQTANIDMTGVTGFYGIGWFDASTSFASVPAGVASDGKTAIPFAGTYDGQGYTISNVTIVKHSYAGVFNNVSGTVKNLTVQDIGLSGTCTEWGCAIVGNASGGSLLENLTAVTSSGFNWGSSANHNVAGIVVRPIGAATIRGCVNNAAISSTSKRLGGIASFVGSGSTGTVFDSCTNNAALVSTDGTRGVGGILGCAEGGVKNAATADDTIIRNCADFGSETAQGSGGHAGAIVGSNWNESYTYTDAGGNTFPAVSPVCGYVKNPVFGLAYAIDAGIDGFNYLTTVAQADLAAGNTYLLLANVAASETPVYTFATAGTIAFDTALGYTFAGTVTTDNGMLDVTDETVGTVTTFTASEGAVVATITKSGNTTSYSTLQKALAAAESGDTVNLVGAASDAVNIPAGVTVELSNADVDLLANVTSLAGEGVISASAGNFNKSFYTDHAATLFAANVWQGTAAISTVALGADALDYYGNSGSTVRISNVSVNTDLYVVGKSNNVKALELTGYLRFNAINNDTTFPCALKGNGSIEVMSTCSQAKKLVFTGDVSEYTGNITLSSSSAQINFGGSTTTSGGSIIVESGSVVTNASAATWTANNLIAIGEIVANGTVNLGSTGRLWCNTGTGVYRANSTNAAVAVASSWNSTYVVGWSPTGTFNPSSYGNANSTVALAADLAANAYFGPGSKTTLDILPTVRLDADIEIKNGYSETNDVALVTFTKLTGDHKFTTSAGTGTEGGEAKIRRYAITTLDNFTGSFKVKAGSELRIATVNVAAGTDLTGRIIAAECDAKATVSGAEADGAITGALALTVAGVSDGKTLEYKADGAEGAGLYVASAPTPVTPEVTPSANGTVDCGSAAAATAAATAINEAKATYIKAPAAANLDSTAAAAYANLFDARADGNNVVVELNEAGTNALETAATNIAAQIVAPANVASILSGTRSLSLVGAQPGVYYSVVYAANLTALATAAEGGRELANADGEVTLPMPATEVGATAGFYRVLVNVQPKVLE